MVGMRVIFNVPDSWVQFIDETNRKDGNSRATWLREAVREKLERDGGKPDDQPS